MPKRRSGSGTVYPGKRGKRFGIRYRDADGRRVSETLGSEQEGWTEKRAEEELEERRVQVRKEGRRKLEPVTFAVFAREWLGTYPDAKRFEAIEAIDGRGLFLDHRGPPVPELGALKLAAIDVEQLERYVARKQRAGLAPRTVNRHLNLLHALFKAAERRKFVLDDSLARRDRAGGACVRRARRRGGRGGAGLVRAGEQARVVFLMVVSPGLRGGEILGLRWRHVSLADPAGALLRVEETWVRGGIDTPKSEKSERMIALGERLASELF